ncbi:MAG: large-conductance mechanosensitive channel protein MscL [Bacteroidales bacterium]|jgi:large conductance mechanosensitive channel|nr:large-conductance mechanosensitive channel protein MscL [Bacteroidales bacterium]
MSFIKEFKEFAVKGNVIDMAVGVIIGAAFGKIVSSLVADIIMPPIGVLLGGMDFTQLNITLQQATETHAAVTLNYGNFVQAAVDFLIIAFAIFLFVKGISRLKKQEETKPTAPSAQEQLLTEIRDLLKNK